MNFLGKKNIFHTFLRAVCQSNIKNTADRTLKRKLNKMLTISFANYIHSVQHIR